MRVYASSIIRTLNAPIHPFDWRLTTAEFAATVDAYQKAAYDVFDFGPSRSALAELDTALNRFYSTANLPGLGEPQIKQVNKTQRRLGRILIPINYSRVVPFSHDPALNVPPLPDLAAALTIPDLAVDDDRLNIIESHLARGQNRLIWALTLAAELVDSSSVS